MTVQSPLKPFRELVSELFIHDDHLGVRSHQFREAAFHRIHVGDFFHGHARETYLEGAIKLADKMLTEHQKISTQCEESIMVT